MEYQLGGSEVAKLERAKPQQYLAYNIFLRESGERAQ
jgi:hypothetical protein